MENKEQDPQKNAPDLTPEEARQKKAYWIGFAIAFGVSVPLAVGAFFLLQSSLGLSFEENKWRLLADTFTLPAILYLMAFLLVKVSNFGAFDAISYSVQLAFLTIFFPNIRKTKLPATYRDYRLAKASKKRSSVSFLLYIGLGYLLLAIIFIMLFYTQR